jgi:ribonuclease E
VTNTTCAEQDASADEIMLVNDVPGEECRIAILRNGRLEDLYTERAATATSVGNIYKARVSNVESAIQAAFVDYGQTQRGFLHISDLHPRYFPGGEQTEKVGQKTTHRDRPLIQRALKRGDEILVQVLKEGIGTKGPTLTSYLSLPGRLMVMMPYMDRVGVTRRVEDEDERKAMRKVLDSLDLPEDFGFILRTAGMGKSKRELNRDVAYLTRMWKVMDKRIDKISGPGELYTESDLVLRTVRDVLRPEIKAIIVDSETAYSRIKAFLAVIAPRSSPPVVHYRRPMPLFHGFGVERQIETIHSRKVDLPSGGQLVIDQTEALVAIDVNSGRSRSARDSETNAYRTNLEAIDEIARQLRLRDLGGLVINDLIDMRQRSRRKEVYEKFGEMLKVDRARTTILPISEFGILEMTRQRMRPSIRMANYVECPGCSGHGEVKAAEMVAADAVREIGYLLHCSETAKLEIVVPPRVASALLSTKRRVLDAIEDRMGKTVDVRVSESIPADRVVYYAYDARGSDLDLTKLSPGVRPTIEALIADADAPLDEETRKSGGQRRSRRRSAKAPPADAAAIALSGDFQRELDELDAKADREEAGESAEETGGTKKKRRRRRRRRRKPEPLIEVASRLYVLAKAMSLTSKEIITRWEGSGGEKNTGFQLNTHMSMITPEQASMIQAWFAGDDDEPTGEQTNVAESAEAETTSRPRRRRRGVPKAESDDATVQSSEDTQQSAEAEPSSSSRRRRRRRRGGSRSGDGGETSTTREGQSTAESDSSTKPAAEDAKTSRKPANNDASQKTDDPATESQETSTGDAMPKRKRSRRRRKKDDSPEVAVEAPSEPVVEAKPEKPRRRTLYGSRRKLPPGAANDAITNVNS